MATTSTISILRPDNSVSSVYCHFDGYPDHHMPILTTAYSTPEAVEALIALGDLSQLGERLEPAEGEMHSFESSAPGVCVAYGRDRGETGTAARTYHGPAEVRLFLQRQEYNYLFDVLTGGWHYKRG